ncbi:energy-coupling factor transporter transmembrane component T family protein [Humibacter ginsenosidimutans]|uniref:Energy-coupling factor transporter transmembrane protein EcfT n=1 Tax=Humibacter ginsenosidimutans TaxID=2599293 RepID=A0A5B8M062_9MICO|nr:energy-coupling factor transporter transmembrane component T [Humibacter ginsenosidimutans]QDZ14047.1 energy-coupling factor transporter transmembrane protein EcfT [Humibacter ginsenosidimutans]
MSIVLTPDLHSSRIARINPVAKLGAALLVSLTLVLTIDWVSAGVALVLEAVLLPFAGVSARQFWLRTAPIWIAAVAAAIATALYGADSGETVWRLGFVTVTQGSLALAGAIALRVLAIGIPGVILFATSDPTELADGLAQLVRLPARFVLGALAALRLVGLFVDDWRALAMARRARGLGDGRNPIAVLRRWGSQAFALLVLSLRRGSKLATAMEAKGFGGDSARTWARSSRFGAAETAMVAIGAAIAVIAASCAVVAGTWSFVVS